MHAFFVACRGAIKIAAFLDETRVEQGSSVSCRVPHSNFISWFRQVNWLENESMCSIFHVQIYHSKETPKTLGCASNK